MINVVTGPHFFSFVVQESRKIRTFFSFFFFFSFCQISRRQICRHVFLCDERVTRFLWRRLVRRGSSDVAGKTRLLTYCRYRSHHCDRCLTLLHCSKVTPTTPLTPSYCLWWDRLLGFAYMGHAMSKLLWV